MDSLLSDEADTTANPKSSHSARENALNATVEGDVYAALDLGTNNCRLLIATSHYADGDIWPTLRVLDSYSRIVRLGEGLGAGGALSEEAIDRTLKALKACRSKLSRFPNAKMRFVTTEACRRASNAERFLRLARDEADMPIEVISNEEEALLAFYGCSSLLKPTATHALTFDIGGGSTEFMWARRESGDVLPEVAGWSTIPFGVMNLSEQFGGTAYTEMYFDEIVERVASMLRDFNAAHGISHILDTQKDKLQLLSTSGTVTTLAAIHLDLSRYDRSRVDGIDLSMKNLRGAVDKLLAMSPSERYHHPCIGSQRADYIISGCAIMEAIHRVWPFEAITIADRGVREGIIMAQLLGQKKQGNTHGE
ncbi:MAG: Ppx/GppA family phosphatase [Alphaproteobacteria bacterium]|nr:Ppx/GppA family phosphatase [Alphaproteobacteria bacterium]